MIVIVLGVSGSGKSTVGRLLAERLRLPFIDADDFHAPEHVAQMRAGRPLTDEQRAPWLRLLSERLRLAEAGGGCVLACSALKEAYRSQLKSGLIKEPEWILLDGPAHLLRARLSERSGHFMPAALLESQLATLERPRRAHVFSISEPPEAIAAAAACLLAGTSL